MNPRDAAVLRAKAAYAATARALGAGLRRVGVGTSPPPGPEHRLRHWAHSLARVHDPAALIELDVPWWTYRASAAAARWLATRPTPARVFEYGSGASTVWLARRAGEVWSVEHDRSFATALQPVLEPMRNVHLRVVEPVPTTAPAVPSAKEGCAGLDFADYVAAIDAIGGHFDLVVIDGRAREACLSRAVARLADDGLIILDNSRRPRYRPAVRATGLVEIRLRGLTPTLPYPDQTSLLTATPSSVPPVRRFR